MATDRVTIARISNTPTIAPPTFQVAVTAREVVDMVAREETGAVTSNMLAEREEALTVATIAEMTEELTDKAIKVIMLPSCLV